MNIGRPKRTVPTPEPGASHRSTNPVGASDAAEQQRLARFRLIVISSTLGVLALIAGAVAAYGPWFRIQNVRVTGTVLVDPASVKSVAEQYLRGQRWLILPKRTLWILSGRNLAGILQKKIQAKLSVERVTVSKRYFHDLLITVTERQAVFRWSNGSQTGTVDRQGIIIGPSTASDQPLAQINDDAKKSFGVDTKIIKPEVIAAMVQLQSILRQNGFQDVSYNIPEPVCPIPVPEAPSTGFVNGNSNANASTVNSQNSQANASVNNNANAANTNGMVNASPVTLPCDPEALRMSSQEIHVQFKDGPAVYFDRHENLVKAVNTLKRLFTSDPTTRKARYIDVRFAERVFVQ